MLIRRLDGVNHHSSPVGNRSRISLQQSALKTGIWLGPWPGPAR